MIAYSALRTAQKRVDLVVASPLPAPLSLYVDPSNVCNFRCTYCPQSRDDYEQASGGPAQMTVANFERICDQILRLGRLHTLNLFGFGEPMVNKQLSELVRIAKRKDVAGRVVIYSNCSLLTQDVALALVEAGLDYLRVSVYGGTEERMADVTGSKISLRRVYNNVHRLRVIRDILHSEKPWIAAKMMADESLEELAAFRTMWADVADETVTDPKHAFHDGADGTGKQVCPLPFFSLKVQSDMQVSACCVDWDRQLIVGDLSKETLADVWRGKKLHDLRIAHLDRRRHEIPACANCLAMQQTVDDVDTLFTDVYRGRYDRIGAAELE